MAIHPPESRVWWNEPIAKVARRAGISAPRVSQIQAEMESAHLQGPMRMLLERYKVKR